jgi:hypothetical protein
METTDINFVLTSKSGKNPPMPPLSEEEYARTKAVLGGEGPWSYPLILRAIKKVVPTIAEQVNARIKNFDQRVRQYVKEIQGGNDIPISKNTKAMMEAKIEVPELKTLKGIVKQRLAGVKLITNADIVKTPMNVKVQLQPNTNLPQIVQDPEFASGTDETTAKEKRDYKPQTAISVAELSSLLPSSKLPMAVQDPIPAPKERVVYTARNAISSAMASADAAMGGGGSSGAGGAVEDEEVSSSDEEGGMFRDSFRDYSTKEMIELSGVAQKDVDEILAEAYEMGESRREAEQSLRQVLIPNIERSRSRIVSEDRRNREAEMKRTRQQPVREKLEARKAALVAEDSLQGMTGPQLRALYASLTSAPVTPFFTKGKIIAEIKRLQGK